MTVNDEDWDAFVDFNIVSDDIIEMIVDKIKSADKLTERELAIYKEQSLIIENKIGNEQNNS